MSLMLLRRRMMAAGDYKPVEYIKSTGTQFICLYPDDPAPEISGYLQIEMDFVLTAEDGGESGLFGAKPMTGDIYAPTFFYVKSAQQLRTWCDMNSAFGDVSAALDVRYSASVRWLVSTGREFTVNGTEKTSANASNINLTREASRHYCFFADGRSSTGHNGSHMRLYGAKISIDGVLLNDIVPRIRLSDNKPGMYDRITKQFFTNIGTDEFVVPTSS